MYKKKVGSIKNELILKSKEAMISAVQIFNNPNIKFKSEIFIVLIIIAWTYLLHAYYRHNKIEYRYYTQKNKKRIFDKTKHKAFKYWELERCLNEKNSPIDFATKQNLKFLIGLRHEIEHQMTTKLDDLFSAKFQACCINYNVYLKKFFKNGIEDKLLLSLQFSSFKKDQVKQLSELDLPSNINSYIKDFDENISEDDYKDSRFSYRLLFIPKSANRKGQADRVIEFIPSDSELAKGINKEYCTFKEKEKIKYKPKKICDIIKEKGYSKFSITEHTKLWKKEDAKNPAKGYGVLLSDGQWYWYDSWLSFVREYCKNNKDLYT